MTQTKFESRHPFLQYLLYITQGALIVALALKLLPEVRTHGGGALTPSS